MGRCWSPGRARTPGSPWWSPACAGCSPARASRSHPSRRRTCPTTRRSPSRAAKSAGRRRCRHAPRAWRPASQFNPILLKPGSDRTSQLVVRGRVAGAVGAVGYIEHRDRLAELVADELASLRSEFNAVICEGAGSPAEINLRATDLANMGLARAANLPVILVGDIDRGGLLAHLFGTVAVLDAGGPGTHRGLRGQQVPRRPGTARAGADATTRADRPAHLRRHPVRRRLVARHRGLRFGAGPPGGRPAATADRRAVAAGGGDSVAPHLQLHRRGGVGVRARGAGALGERRRPTCPTPTSS